MDLCMSWSALEDLVLSKAESSWGTRWVKISCFDCILWNACNTSLIHVIFLHVSIWQGSHTVYRRNWFNQRPCQRVVMSRYEEMLMQGNESSIYKMIVVLNSRLWSGNVCLRLSTLNLVCDLFVGRAHGRLAPFDCCCSRYIFDS